MVMQNGGGGGGREVNKVHYGLCESGEYTKRPCNYEDVKKIASGALVITTIRIILRFWETAHLPLP